MRKILVSGFAIALALSGGQVAADRSEGHAGRRLTATLTGANEVPGPGDANGSGSAAITLNQGQDEVCYTVTFSDIAAPTAAHIHRGPAGVAGPVVVGLTISGAEDGEFSGCVVADADLIRDIRQNPSSYYVNVHNAEFPAGAIRGQLEK